MKINDLYSNYPDFLIDVQREQQLCQEHDVIIFQHLFYWYSSPATVREWMDLVLQHVWAYGSKGRALEGKQILQTLTPGGDDSTYQPEGYNEYTIGELTSPLKQQPNSAAWNGFPPLQFWEYAGGFLKSRSKSMRKNTAKRSLLFGTKHWIRKKSINTPIQRRARIVELFLIQLFIFLAAAAIAVPLAKKLGLGSVLGYLIAGFGRLGTDLGRFLITAEIKPVILDNDASNVDVLRKFDFEVYYGDITLLDLLEAAGAAEAELLLITIGDLDKTGKLVELARKHYPHLKIAAKVSDRSSAFELMDMGVHDLQRETFGSALALDLDALSLLGFDNYEAYKLMRLFRKKEEDMLPELYKMHKKDKSDYISLYRKHTRDLEEVMNLDKTIDMVELDRAWTVANPED